ncbi:hypothetical protein POTOM_037741 [Populus tomentosa]|uniref:EGF-like domain-containing protein n=1 Tax=Populus tomentosa TaxID=118781 RepID=A0A8X8CKD9_POPTO|nr:hypothetical protein POTOM_037741 [Populus tomentosa]
MKKKRERSHEKMVYASTCVTWVAILFLLQPLIARSGFLSPLLSPVFDDVCKKVECGKGTCKPSDNSTWFFECECDPGWKQTSSDHHDHLKFLPCIVPDCTLNFSCMAAPSPVQGKANKDNESIFEPCFWTDCGGGSCNKTSTFTYSCACAEGYNNLLNVSAFPCYRDCAIGMDCRNLGISVSNKSASVDNSRNQVFDKLPYQLSLHPEFFARIFQHKRCCLLQYISICFLKTYDHTVVEESLSFFDSARKVPLADDIDYVAVYD